VLRKSAPVLFLVLCSACAKPTPLQADCKPGPHQVAACELRSNPGAEIRFILGEKTSAAFGARPDGTLPLEISSGELPFDVRVVRFVAKAPHLGQGEVEWALPALRYHASITVNDAAIATVRFEVTPGATLSWANAPLAAGAPVTIDLLRDLPLDKLTGSSTRQLPLSLRGADGATLDDTLEVSLPAGLEDVLVPQIRTRGTALTFAATFDRDATSPRPGILVASGELAALGGLARLGDTQIIVFAEDDQFTDVEFCGVYQVGALATSVSRVRMSRDVEAFEARTGRPLAKSTLRGSVPRGCRDYEKVQKDQAGLYPAMITGSRVDDAAIASWAGTLGAPAP